LPPWVSPPYFESGYPYGRDQFISTAGANWGIRALALALGSPAVPDDLPLAAVAPTGIEPWVETAMFGTSADLKKLLDRGLSPNAATEVGQTSLLMMVVPDVGKMRLQIDRGANVNARSVRKYSALLVAGQYQESTEAIRLLLARGAEVGSKETDGKPAADAFPTFFASHAGHSEILRAFRQAGDKLDDPTIMFGAAPVTPLMIAVAFEHTDTVRTLLDLGARVDPAKPRVETALLAAIFGNHLDLARLLIARGADVNRPAERGRTPLMYAAATGWGDAAMIDLLLKSGARADLRDDDGLSAADYARKYHRDDLVARLRGSASARR